MFNVSFDGNEKITHPVFSTAPCTQKVATCISQPVSLTQSLYLLREDTDLFSHLATVLVYTDVPL